MLNLDEIATRITGAVPGAEVRRVPNGSPGGPDALCVDNAHARDVALFLRDDPGLRLDYASNVTGVDWLDSVTQVKTRSKEIIDGVEREIEHVQEVRQAGFLEVVYHLYSMALRHGPLALKLRTGNRVDQVHVPSLTPVWRSAEFQEREVFDLFGVRFEGHPDLRRILMWDNFQDHPMRKDYLPPDDHEYEPTAHDEVLQRARAQRGRTSP